MTPKQAMELIVHNSSNPALNYAINYAKVGLTLDEGGMDFRVQCLYILNNIINWRYNKSYNISKETIKEVRQALKDGAK